MHRIQNRQSLLLSSPTQVSLLCSSRYFDFEKTTRLTFNNAVIKLKANVLVTQPLVLLYLFLISVAIIIFCDLIAFVLESKELRPADSWRKKLEPIPVNRYLSPSPRDFAACLPNIPPVAQATPLSLVLCCLFFCHTERGKFTTVFLHQHV